MLLHLLYSPPGVFYYFSDLCSDSDNGNAVTSPVLTPWCFIITVICVHTVITVMLLHLLYSPPGVYYYSDLSSDSDNGNAVTSPVLMPWCFIIAVI